MRVVVVVYPFTSVHATNPIVSLERDYGGCKGRAPGVVGKTKRASELRGFRAREHRLASRVLSLWVHCGGPVDSLGLACTAK